MGRRFWENPDADEFAVQFQPWYAGNERRGRGEHDDHEPRLYPPTVRDRRYGDATHDDEQQLDTVHD